MFSTKGQSSVVLLRRPASTVPVRAVRPSFIRFYPFHDDRRRSGLPDDPDAADWACLARLLSFASLLRAFVPPPGLFCSPTNLAASDKQHCMVACPDFPTTNQRRSSMHAPVQPFFREILFFSLTSGFKYAERPGSKKPCRIGKGHFPPYGRARHPAPHASVWVPRLRSPDGTNVLQHMFRNAVPVPNLPSRSVVRF